MTALSNNQNAFTSEQIRQFLMFGETLKNIHTRLSIEGRLPNRWLHIALYKQAVIATPISLKTIIMKKVKSYGNTTKHSQSHLIYNRKSTDDALNQKNSLVYQRAQNVEYAKREGLNIASLTVPGFCTNGVVDESHSGFKEDADFEISDDGTVRHAVSRPKFLQLVRLLKEKQIKGAIFLTWDRASRNKQDSVLLQKLIRQGSDIRFVEANYDKSSAGDLHMDIDGMFAAHYSRTISEKVRHAYEKLRAEGRCTYTAPIGYLDQGSDSKLLDPERAPLVKRVFELYATGEWSFVQLAKWANQQGLAQKPQRRKRSKEEILSNLDVSTLPKISRPVTRKTIEYILSNPFFIGRIKAGDGFRVGKHQPLIDTALFNRVQEILKQQNVSVRYVDKLFFVYRGLAYCTCGRVYTPYEQKGSVYYRSNCKEGCDNRHPNLNETEINDMIQDLFDRMHFTDEELAEIEIRKKTELSAVTEARDKKLADLQLRQRKIIADLGYLAENRVSLMRAGGWAPEAVRDEKTRLNGLLKGLNDEIEAYGENAVEMVRYILTFSELVKNAGLYFNHALDNERRELAVQAFSEIVIKDKKLVSAAGRDGFDALLRRIWLTGSQGGTSSEP